jgi:hypothetical protein
MAEATITITGSYLNPDDTPATGSVSFTAADQVDITNAKIAIQKAISFPITNGILTGATLLATPGGYRVTETISGGAFNPSFVIGGTTSIDLSSVNRATAQFDASGIGVMVIEDIPSGATYNTVLADVSKQKRCTVATDQTFNVNGSIPYGIGSTMEVLNWSTGRLHLAGINGSVLRQADNALILRKQFSGAVLEKVTATEWWVQGDVSTT